MAPAKRLILGTVALTLLGSVFHFAYEWLNHSDLAAPLFAVNESVWEHMKLLSTAGLVSMAADWFLAGPAGRANYFAVRAGTLPLAILTIPLVFYFLEGALGVESLAADILLFVLACALYQGLSQALEARHPRWARCNGLGIAGLTLLFLVFAALTFAPPRLPLWMDPLTGTYGIPR